MNLGIIAPAFYPDESYVRHFLASAKRYQLVVGLYGIGQPFTHWIDTHIRHCVNCLRAMSCSHVLFTDAVDVLFLTGITEIAEKYLALGSPDVLMAYESAGPNAGGWIAERYAIIETLGTLLKFDSGDPQERWREAISLRKIDVVLDLKRRIFQVVDASDIGFVASADNGKSANTRIYNKNTETLPCLLHCAGGGKDERMEPWLKKLGYK